MSTALEPDLFDTSATAPVVAEASREAGKPAPVPPFADLGAFVTGWLVHAYARATRDADNGFKWCPRWHEHPGARWRLEDLWAAYEAAAVDPSGGARSRWWREHADPAMAALTDPDRGPFVRCGPTRHELPPPLPVTGRFPKCPPTLPTSAA